MSKASYFSTLCTSSALLAGKMTLVHFLVVRARFMSEDPALPHDVDGKLNPILKKILLCDYFKGAFLSSPAFVQHGERLEKNCAESEPYFLMLATLSGLTGAAPASMGALMIKVFTASRFLHSGVFCLGEKVNASFRSAAWLGGVAATMALSAFGLKGNY